MAKRPRMPTFFIGAAPVASEEEVSDYMPVGPGDKGDSYGDRGQLGSYATNDGKPFEPPAEVKFFDGQGASMEDIRRGFVKPTITANPAYDKVNYSRRSTQPRMPDEDVGNTGSLPDDWEFQNRNVRAKGFLTRPKIPTER